MVFKGHHEWQNQIANKMIFISLYLTFFWSSVSTDSGFIPALLKKEGFYSVRRLIESLWGNLNENNNQIIQLTDVFCVYCLSSNIIILTCYIISLNYKTS